MIWTSLYLWTAIMTCAVIKASRAHWLPGEGVE